jgi:Right handed beta helix region
MSRRRLYLALLVVLVLAGFVVLGRWYAPHRAAAPLSPHTLALTVSSGADRGPGSLREALFTADAAGSAARIRIGVARITLQSALPPLVNPHGLSLAADARVRAHGGVLLDAHALGAGTAAIDVDAPGVTLTDLVVQGCAGTAILVRAARFTLSGSSVERCDVGVDIATGEGRIELARNLLQGDRIGVRFSAASPDSVLVNNRFASDATGLWMVASQPGGAASAPLQVTDNRFSADGTAIVTGNVPTLIAQNDFTGMSESAVHVVGAQAIVRSNHISSGPAAGIVVENAAGAIIDGNDLEHLRGYAILLRGSAGALVRGNRIQSCGYGLAFVLGNAQRPGTAVDNTLIDLQYDGIDVIGDSPILRGNHVLLARVTPLHVTDFSPPHGPVVRSHPLLEGNHLQPGAAQLAAAAHADRVRAARRAAARSAAARTAARGSER